ncbi:MAG: PIN domain-containing protein [archaeon]
MRYYVDTCIWRDFWEDRKDPRPLGEYAEKFFLNVFKRKDTLLFSDRILAELKIALSSDEIEQLFSAFVAAGLLEKVPITEGIREKARKGPLHYGDMIHALLAREHDAVLVTRDKHFRSIPHIKPESIQ